jgi:hypothetical protein
MKPIEATAIYVFNVEGFRSVVYLRTLFQQLTPYSFQRKEDAVFSDL